MQPKTKFILGGIGILILLILVILLFIFAQPFNKKNQPTQKQTSDISPLPASLAEVPTPAVIQPPPPGPIEEDPERIAADFAERYGSYSNQNDYQNLKDMFLQMTDSQRTSIQKYISDNPLKAGEYSATTTKTVRTEIISKTDSKAVIKVYTQRTESTAANPQSRVYYQNADLKLVKDGLKWLVDDFKWL